MKRTRMYIAMFAVVTSIARADFPQYAISQPLGLFDSRHTNFLGYHWSVAQYLKGQYVAGFSWAYKGSSYFGESVWWTDGQRIERLGFTSGDYTQHVIYYLSGIQKSFLLGMNSEGKAIGISVPNPDDSFNQFGGTPWLFDGVNTTVLGISGPGYLDSAGRRSGNLLRNGINEAGQIVGVSHKRNSNGSGSEIPWIYENGNYLPIGFTGPDYTFADGSTHSNVYKLNQAGQVLGDSARSSGKLTGWITNGVNYTYVGLVRPDNLNDTSFDDSTPVYMNQAGQAAGTAFKFANSGVMTYAVWLYDGVESRRVGLLGDGYTGPATGFQRSELVALSEGGYVLGTSSLVPQSYDFGTATWTSDGVTTRRTGIWDTLHTRSDGWQVSYPQSINRDGHSAGRSRQYDGMNELGLTAWIDDRSRTRVVGHYDALHTRSDGYQYSQVNFLADSGNATGYSKRYAGSTDLGETGWYYDAQTDSLIDLVFAVGPNGQAFTALGPIYGDGTVSGTYYTYNSDGSIFQSIPFLWSPKMGKVNLEDTIVIGLQKWDNIRYVERQVDDDFLGVGSGGNGTAGEVSFVLRAITDGDFSGNGVVDAADYVVWRKNGGTLAGYDKWRYYFGSGERPGLFVPEPDAILLVPAIVFVCSITRRIS